MSLLDETMSRISEDIIYMTLQDQIKPLSSIDETIETILLFAETIYQREYGSRFYFNKFFQHTTLDSYMHIKYPFDIIKQDPNYNPLYITFDQNLSPLYLRWFNGYNWEFITSNKLTQNNVLYNYHMLETTNPETVRLHKKDNPERFHLLKTHISIHHQTINKSNITKLIHVKQLTQQYTNQIIDVVKDSLPMPFPFHYKFYPIQTREIDKFGLKLIGKSQYFDNTYSLWTFQTQSNNIQQLKSQINKSLDYLRSIYLPEIINAGLIFVRFKFKYITEPDLFDVTTQKFVYQGGNYLLFSRGNQINYQNPNSILYEDKDISKYLYIKTEREYNQNTNTYSDKSEYTSKEYLDTTEYQIEVTMIKAMRGGGFKENNNSTILYQELNQQRALPSTKFRSLDSMKWLGDVKNRFDQGNRNGCFIHCIKEKLEELSKIYQLTTNDNNLFVIPKTYTTLWQFIDQKVQIDSYNKNSFPFTEEYIKRTAELFKITINQYDINGNFYDSYHPSISIGILDILIIPMGNNNFHFAYIQSFNDTYVKNEEYQEISIDIPIDFETINYNDSVFPYSVSYRIINDNIKTSIFNIELQSDTTELTENIFAKSDIEIISYGIIDELFTKIKDYIHKKTNIITDYTEHFKEFCKNNCLSYSNDFDFLVSNFIYYNGLTTNEYLLPWNEKVNLITKNKEFQKQYDQYKSNYPLKHYKVRLIAYNGSKFDFNILFQACLHLNIEIIVPPSSTGKINKFVFSLSTPKFIRIDVECWDLNNYFRESLLDVYTKFINEENKSKIKESIDHKIIQEIWNNNNSMENNLIDNNKSFIGSLNSLKSLDNNIQHKLKSLKQQIVDYNNNDVDMMIDVYNKLDETINSIIPISPETSYQNLKSLMNDEIYLKPNNKRISDFPTISNFSYHMYEKSNTIYKLQPLTKRSRKFGGYTHELKGKKIEFTPTSSEDETLNILIRDDIIGARVQIKSGKFKFKSDTNSSGLAIEIDVTSLYPYIMLTYKFPIGIQKISNDHLKILNSSFEGFFYCEYTNIVSENRKNFYLPYFSNDLKQDKTRIWDVSKMPNWEIIKRRGYLPKCSVIDMLRTDQNSLKFVIPDNSDPSVIYWDDTLDVTLLDSKMKEFFGISLNCSQIVNDINKYIDIFNKLNNGNTQILCEISEFMLNEKLYKVYMYHPSEFNKFIQNIISLADYQKHILNFCFCLEFRSNKQDEGNNYIRLIDILFHKTTISPFKAFFERLKEGKMNSKNKIEENTWKSLQNNLSGKMSQAPFMDDSIIIDSTPDFTRFLNKIVLSKIGIRCKYDFITSKINQDDSQFTEFPELSLTNNSETLHIDNRKKFKRKVIHKILKSFNRNKLDINPFLKSKNINKESNIGYKANFEIILDYLVNSIMNNNFVLLTYLFNNKVYLYVNELGQFPEEFRHLWSFSINDKLENLQERIRKYYFTHAILDIYEVCNHLNFLSLKSKIRNYLEVKYLDNEQHNDIAENILDVDYDVYTKKNSFDQSTSYVSYENHYRTSNYPIHIGSYILASARSYMWNSCLSKVDYYCTDTDSAFIHLSELDKIQGLYSLDRLYSNVNQENLTNNRFIQEILDKYMNHSVNNDYSIFKGEILFDEFIGICKKFYCLLMKGKVVKYRTKGISEDGYYVDSTYVLYEAFKLLTPKIKQSDLYKTSSEFKNEIDSLITLNQENLLKQEIYLKLEKIIETHDDSNTVNKVLINYSNNYIITSKFISFKDNVKQAFETLLDRPLYFTSSSFVSSRRRGKFTYTETLKLIQKDN